jgi:hypothetical protein
MDTDDILAELVMMAKLNLDEHDKIWKSIEKLRDVQLETMQRNDNLVAAIRELINHIPPGNLA